MTSASELFYSRRPRLGRTSNDLEFDSLPDRNLHFSSCNRRHNQHHHRSPRDVDGSDNFRRSSHVRQHCHRASHVENGSMPFDLTNQCLSSNSANTENLWSRNSPRLTGSGRLPGAVLLARARLLERLRGVAPSGNGVILPECSFARGTLFADLTSMERAQFLHERNKKPPGLIQEALECLNLEVLSCRETGLEGLESRASHDCSICLENFMEGDQLTCLPCGHKFHSFCLNPWVRTCGDCPYCRRDIVLTK